MKQEYKDFLQHLFHDKDHVYEIKISEPDYYSGRFKILRETDNTIDLELSDNFLKKPIHDLLLNLMEWDLIITGLAISTNPKDYDDEYLWMQITEPPMADAE